MLTVIGVGGGNQVYEWTTSDEQMETKIIFLTDTATLPYNHPSNPNLLYRGMMMNSSEFPEIGTNARKLGVRDSEVIVADGLVSPGGGGISVSPLTPLNLPTHRRPSEFGGTGKDPVWAIDRSILESYGLTYRQTSPTHGLIEPWYLMSLAEFRLKLADIQTQWQLVLPIEDNCKP